MTHGIVRHNTPRNIPGAHGILTAMVMTWTARALEPEELAAVSANSKVVVDLLEDEPPNPKLAVDLDTAWHGIHWLLTGTAYDAESPAGQAIFGGDPIGHNLGNGPAHLLDGRTVKRIADALRNLSADDLAARYDPDSMLAADIYPGFWFDPAVFEELLRPRYRELRKFYRRAAKNGRAILTAIL